MRTLMGRGLVLLAAAPLLGGVAAAPGARADASVPAVREESGGAAAKPPPRQKAHGAHKSKKHSSKKHGSKKHGSKKHAKSKGHGNKHGKKHGKQAHHGVRPAKHKVHTPKTQAHNRVVLHTDGPERAVLPGHTYEWSFDVLAKGPQKSAKAVLLLPLPRSLVFVSGTGCKATGRTIVCDLGTLRQGRWTEGEFKARVSKHARSGETIALRGTVLWGAVVDAENFPAVRVVKPEGRGDAKAPGRGDAKSSGHKPSKQKPSGHGQAEQSKPVTVKAPPDRARTAGTP